MNLRVMPRQVMNPINIHPLSGKVCQTEVVSGRAAIRMAYLSTMRLNIKKKPASTPAVMSSSHQRSAVRIVAYARIPLTVIIIPGMPQIAAAMQYRSFLFIPSF